MLGDGSANFTPGISERRSSTTTYLHSALKNADVQTGNFGSITGSRRYDAFGNVVSSSGTWQGPFGNAGGFGYQEDSDHGLKLLGHRYYDSSTGRFLSRDPVKDGRNWYVYCSNSPVVWMDAQGLAKIYVGWRQVVPGFYHMFIIIVDEKTGWYWTIGGGPLNHGLSPSGPGPVTDYSGELRRGRGKPYEKGNYENTSKSPSSAPWDDFMLIYDDDKPGYYWYNRLRAIGKAIERAKTEYDKSGPNSNSYIFSILQASGLLDNFELVFDNKFGKGRSKFLDELDDPFPCFPGWGMSLPKKW